MNGARSCLCRNEGHKTRSSCHIMSIRRDACRIPIIAFALLLGACQANPYQWDKQTADKVEGAMADARRDAGRTAVPKEVSEALLAPLDAGADPRGAGALLEPRFDLSVNNAPARQVFMGLVESTPYSMVVHPEVGGNVTLHLKNATVPEAMEALRTVYGYEFRRAGNRFMVLGRGMQARIYPVNYLNLERKGRSLTRVSSGELSQSGAPPVAGQPAGGAPTGQAASSVRVETDSKVDFWKDMQESLKTIIGTANGRQVVVNPQAGIVIVRAMPDELRMVEEYLGVTHASVNRQVILEAKVIEIELKDGYQTGINWAALGSNSTFGMVGGGSIFQGGGVSEIAGNIGNLNPGGTFSAISGTNASAFGGVFSAAIKTADFAAFLELLKSQGNVHVLSSPRVSTVNNQKAVIKVGGDEFFVTSVTAGTAATLSSAATSPSVVLTPFFSGISLDVTPQIDEGSNIILHIHPAVSEVVQKSKAFQISGEDFNLPLASSSIQESDNVVRALNGQIIVIGGLMKEGSTDQDASIPFLGDIPILGNAFKHKRVARIKKELVILLKPTVVDNNQVWENAIQDSQGRMQKLRR
jgi:MSHA biogenesis protein MshL